MMRIMSDELAKKVLGRFKNDGSVRRDKTAMPTNHTVNNTEIAAVSEKTSLNYLLMRPFGV